MRPLLDGCVPTRRRRANVSSGQKISTRPGDGPVEAMSPRCRHHGHERGAGLNDRTGRHRRRRRQHRGQSGCPRRRSRPGPRDDARHLVGGRGEKEVFETAASASAATRRRPARSPHESAPDRPSRRTSATGITRARFAGGALLTPNGHQSTRSGQCQASTDGRVAWAERAASRRAGSAEGAKGGARAVGQFLLGTLRAGPCARCCELWRPDPGTTPRPLSAARTGRGLFRPPTSPGRHLG